MPLACENATFPERTNSGRSRSSFSLIWVTAASITPSGRVEQLCTSGNTRAGEKIGTTTIAKDAGLTKFMESGTPETLTEGYDTLLPRSGIADKSTDERSSYSAHRLLDGTRERRNVGALRQTVARQRSLAERVCRQGGSWFCASHQQTASDD